MHLLWTWQASGDPQDLRLYSSSSLIEATALKQRCAWPSLWEVHRHDFVEALARPGFVELHVAPCLCISASRRGRLEGSDLSVWERHGSAALVPCLPEHPWFSRGSSGFLVEMLARTFIPEAGGAEVVAPGLSNVAVCVELFCIATRVLMHPGHAAGEFAAIKRQMSRGRGEQGNPGLGALAGSIAAAAQSRWGPCVRAALAAIGSAKLAAAKEGHAARSQDNNRTAQLARGRWTHWLVQHFHDAIGATEDHADDTMARVLDAAKMAATLDQAEHERRRSVHSGQQPAAIALPMFLCPRRGGEFDQAGVVHLQSLQGSTAGRAVAHVLAASLVAGHASVFRAARLSLEVLLFVDGGSDGGPRCLVAPGDLGGNCRSLLRPPLLAWKCSFSFPRHGAEGAKAASLLVGEGESTDGVAVSHWGTETLVSCPVPDGVAHRIGHVLSTPDSSFWASGDAELPFLEVMLSAPGSHAHAVAGVLPLCLQRHGAGVQGWSSAGGAVGQSLLPIAVPEWGLVGCSAPMWLGSPTHRKLVVEWLAYHRTVGFDKFFVYDLDASLEEAVAPFVKDGFVVYVPRWPAHLSGACASLHLATDTGDGAKRRYCTQSQAEAHCIWNARGRARWVMLLHSFDAYAGAGVGGLQDGLRPVFERLEPRRHEISVINVLRFDFASPVEAASKKPFPVFATSLWRQRSPTYMDGTEPTGRGQRPDVAGVHNHAGTVLLNPEHAVSPFTHWARGRPRTVHLTMDPNTLRENHYVDILGSPRCATAAAAGAPPCDVFDNTSAWAASHTATISLTTPATLARGAPSPSASTTAGLNKSEGATTRMQRARLAVFYDRDCVVHPELERSSYAVCVKAATESRSAPDPAVAVVTTDACARRTPAAAAMSTSGAPRPGPPGPAASLSRMMFLVPGHALGRPGPRLQAVLANVDHIARAAGGAEVPCLVFDYRPAGPHDKPFEPSPGSGDIYEHLADAGCVVEPRAGGMFLEFLADPALERHLRKWRPLHVLMVLDDILLPTKYCPTRFPELLGIMSRNSLDVVSPALVGNHLSYEGMRVQTLRRANAVGRRVNFIEWQCVLFTAEAFDVLRHLVRPELSKTWGYDILFSAAFRRVVGRPPRMGIVDAMTSAHTGSWSDTEMSEQNVYQEYEALLDYYARNFNLTPAPVTMRRGYLF